MLRNYVKLSNVFNEIVEKGGMRNHPLKERGELTDGCICESSCLIMMNGIKTGFFVLNCKWLF